MTTQVGLFGRLGSGNIGNDGTLEAMLAQLRSRQPESRIDCMCSGPDVVTARYGIPARKLHWLGPRRALPWPAFAMVVTGFLILVGLVVDARHTAAWVRRHDIVIVPGMGSLEANLPEQPWQMPWSLFLLALFGRIYGTKVALVGVGATYIPGRLNRFLMVSAARMAAYRSFRDDNSREEMRQMGLHAEDEVYPDMVFGMPVATRVPSPGRTVGVGVMAYAGANEDRAMAEEILEDYIGKMTHFVGWLTDQGYDVRLLIGDFDDRPVARSVLASVRADRPHLSPEALVFEPVVTLEETMRVIAGVEVVVGTRYHNVVCALSCATPTIAIAYGAKHDAVMAEMGMAELSHPIRELDIDRLIAQFTEVYHDRCRIATTLETRRSALVERLEQQFADLSQRVFAPTAGTPHSARSATRRSIA